MDRWLEYEGFSTVSEKGSFTEAAAALGVSASAVSKQVRSLEERLGTRLFHRTTRSVALTDEGRTFYDRVRPLLHLAIEAEQDITECQTRLRGVLRLAAPMDFGKSHLVEPLADFSAEHPNLSLEVEFADRFVDLVDEGFDLAIRIGRLPDSSLVSRRLAPCRRVLCASPAYLEREGRPERPKDLKRHSRIVYAYETESNWRFRESGRSTSVTVPIRHRSNNGTLIQALARKGLGIALLPTFMIADDLRSGRLEALFPDVLDHDITIHAVYPNRKLLSAKVRSLVDFLAEHCGPMPYWDAGIFAGPSRDK
jgi:DNA-binding transcriptional LysR family regulator